MKQLKSIASEVSGKWLLGCLMLIISAPIAAQQKSVAVIKTELEQSTNPPLYVKDVLKKRFVLDTVAIMRIGNFKSIRDSLAYHGKIKKVYGPYNNGKILIQVLAKLPNTFYHLGQIFIDTAVFTRRKADSLTKDIVQQIKDGRANFGDMAQTWSMGGEGASRGDMGWIAEGMLIPEIQREIQKKKKGEVFVIWTKKGAHIIKKFDSKQDHGFALLMRVTL